MGLGLLLVRIFQLLNFVDGSGDGGHASSFEIIEGNARFGNEGKTIIGSGTVKIKYTWSENAFNIRRR